MDTAENDSDEVIRTKYRSPFAWWGPRFLPPQPLSVVELIEAGNFDERTAALLWLCLEQHQSLLVAAGPPEVGKTATLSALLDFIPASYNRVFLRGNYESFEYLNLFTPEKTFLLINELSDHLDVYLWGRKAGRAFQSLELGFSLLATLHAESQEEILEQLQAAPVRATNAQLVELGLSLILSPVVRQDADGWRWERRTTSLALFDSDQDGNLLVQTLVRWQEKGDYYQHYNQRPGEIRPLAKRLGLEPADVLDEIARRSDFLSDLRHKAVLETTAFQQALLDFH